MSSEIEWGNWSGWEAPVRREDVSAGEMFADAEQKALKVDNAITGRETIASEFDKRNEAIKAATGVQLDNPMRSIVAAAIPSAIPGLAGPFAALIKSRVSGYSQDERVAAYNAQLADLALKHPEHASIIDPTNSPMVVAQKRAAEMERRSAELSEKAGLVQGRDIPALGKVPLLRDIGALGYNLAAHPINTAAQFAGSMSGQLQDPVETAMQAVGFAPGMSLGGKAAAQSVLKHALMNAAANTVLELGMQPLRQMDRKELGLDYGWDRFFASLEGAAASGFVLDAAIRTPYRAGIRRFGRDTPAETPFSKHGRGGFFTDAVPEVTPIKPRVREKITEDEIKRGEAGDLDAIESIARKSGALEDPAIRGLMDYAKLGGQVDEEIVARFKKLGLDHGEGMKYVSLMMEIGSDRYVRTPEPIRPAAEPLDAKGAAEVTARIADLDAKLANIAPEIRQAIKGGIEAELPEAVRAARALLAGDDVAAKAALDAAGGPIVVMDRAAIHTATDPVVAAMAIRRSPEAFDSNVPLRTDFARQVRAIAALDEPAFQMLMRSEAHPAMGEMVADRVAPGRHEEMLRRLAGTKSFFDAKEVIASHSEPRTRAPELPEAKMSDPTGPEAKAQTEALEKMHAAAVEDAMAPIKKREELEQKVETLKGEIAKLEEKAKAEVPTSEKPLFAISDDVANKRAELRAVERELEQAKADQAVTLRDPALYRAVMQRAAIERQLDVRRALDDALTLADRILPSETRVTLRADDIMYDGYRLDASSDMATGDIQLATYALNPAGRIGHEGVHTLRTLGHLSPQEIELLATAGRERGVFTPEKEATYRDAYSGRANVADLINEEAASHAIEARINGTDIGPANTIAERIKQTIERFRNLLNGYGFKTAEDVMAAIMDGDVARRSRRADWARETVVEGKRSMGEAALRGVTMPDGTVINGVPLMAAIRAFHGSPHDFDKFDLSRIGTGEGAQAFGSGLYFAEAREVADSYRSKPSSRNVPSPADKARADILSRNAEQFGKLAISDSLLIKDFGALDVKARSDVLSVMRGLLNDGEVAKAVVRLIPVDMMDMLVGEKLSPKALLDKPTMLIDLLPVNANDAIPSRVSPVDMLAPYVALATAESPLIGPKSAGQLREALSTRSASKGDLRHSGEIPYPYDPSNGRLYEVRINADPGHFLDWDKPLSQQSEKVRDAISPFMRKEWELVDPRGIGSPLRFDDESLAKATAAARTNRVLKEVEPSLTTFVGHPSNTTKLRDAGIPGVKYLDQGSRDAGTGSHNYVVFDDSLIEIVAKDGVPLKPRDVMAAIRDDQSAGRSMRHDLDALGYYSKALEAAKALKQEKGTPEQMLAMLKAAGVKEGEIEATGLGALLPVRQLPPGAKSVQPPEKLFGSGTMKAVRKEVGSLPAVVTKADIIKHLEENRVQVKEVIYNKDAEADIKALRAMMRTEMNKPIEQVNWSRIDEIEAKLRPLEEAFVHGVAGDAYNAPKWDSYSLDPSNPTYRETVLHLPESRPSFEVYLKALQGKGLAYDSPSTEMLQRYRDRYEAGDWRNVGDYKNLSAGDANFRNGHFPEPNVIAHMRTSMQKDAQGRPVFHVDELQSDWGQKLRDGGVRDEAKIAELRKAVDESNQDLRQAIDASKLHSVNTPAAQAANDVLQSAARTAHLRRAELRTAEAATPGHPLVNTTDQWTNTAMRRAIRQAVEAGADYIAIPSGETVHSYGMGAPLDGLKYAYNEMYPKNLRNILQKMDKSVQAQRVEHLYSPVDGKAPERSHGHTLFPLTDEIKRKVMGEGQALFAFAGENAKTADHTALAKARQMDVEGYPREDIWRDTGWFRGVDGKWRFEVDDSGVKSVGGRIVSGELEKAYENLPDVKRVSVLDTLMGFSGLYEKENNVIRVGIGNRSKILAHELQHAIQSIEDFQGGLNPSSEFSRLQESRRTNADGRQQLLSKIKELEKAARNESDTDVRRVLEMTAEELDVRQAEAWKKFKPSILSKVYDFFSAERAYLRASGEVEARAVEKRMNLNAEQRRERPPWLDYDVPEADQIVRFSDKMFALSDERPIKSDLAIVDRMRSIAEAIGSCA